MSLKPYWIRVSIVLSLFVGIAIGYQNCQNPRSFEELTGDSNRTIVGIQNPAEISTFADFGSETIGCWDFQPNVDWGIWCNTCCYSRGYPICYSNQTCGHDFPDSGGGENDPYGGYYDPPPGTSPPPPPKPENFCVFPQPGQTEEGISCPDGAESCRVDVTVNGISLTTVVKAADVLSRARAVAGAYADYQVASFKALVGFFTEKNPGERVAEYAATEAVNYGRWISSPCEGSSDAQLRCLYAKMNSLASIMTEAVLFGQGTISKRGVVSSAQLAERELNRIVDESRLIAEYVETYMKNTGLDGLETCTGAACEQARLNILSGIRSYIVDVYGPPGGHALTEIFDRQGRLIGTQTWGEFFAGKTAREVFRDEIGGSLSDYVERYRTPYPSAYIKWFENKWPNEPFPTPELVRKHPDLFKGCP